MLDAPVGAEPAPVRGANRLHAANVDAKRAFDRWLSRRRELLATIAVRGTYLDDDDVARLLKLSLPGIDEVIGLLEVVRLARDADGAHAFDQVVVDTAPTGHTLRLLAAPALLTRVASLLDSLQSHHRAVVSALRGSYRGDAADALIDELERDGEALRAMLRDPRRDAGDVDHDSRADGARGDVRRDRRAGGHRHPGRPPDREPHDCGAAAALRLVRGTPAIRGARAGSDRPAVRRPRNRCVSRVDARASRGAGAARRGKGAGTLEDCRRDGSDAATDQSALESHLTLRPRPRQGFSAKRDWSGFSQKIILFGGKGGVGKTTCAAAAALHLAAAKRVLLLSTDPAHSLGDVFGARFDNTAPARARRSAGAARAGDRRGGGDGSVPRQVRRGRGRGLRAHCPDRGRRPGGVPRSDRSRAAGHRRSDCGRRRRRSDRRRRTATTTSIVTDTAPTGHALRLLQTPAVLRDWTLALMAILLKYREIVGAGTLAALLVQLSKRLRGLQDILADPAQVALRHRDPRRGRPGAGDDRRSSRRFDRWGSPSEPSSSMRRAPASARGAAALRASSDAPSSGSAPPSRRAVTLSSKRPPRFRRRIASQRCGLGTRLAATHLMAQGHRGLPLLRREERATPAAARTPDGLAGAGAAGGARSAPGPLADCRDGAARRVRSGRLEPRLQDLDWVATARRRARSRRRTFLARRDGDRDSRETVHDVLVGGQGDRRRRRSRRAAIDA